MNMVIVDKAALESVQKALAVLKDHIPSAPERNCSCHISPLCHNCVERTSAEHDVEMLTAADNIIAAALSQAVDQEPVAEYIGENLEGSMVLLSDDIPKGTKLFTHPAPAKPLSVEQYTEIAHRTASHYFERSDARFIEYAFLPHTLEQFVRKLEAALGINQPPALAESAQSAMNSGATT